ncbi:MAG: adenylate/guanylate cyclase domain-containing protein [Burkholderiales bacterium]|nr:adenylate/guanylate cyclase domain-containing protein [Burkholderiales bacterium]
MSTVPARSEDALTPRGAAAAWLLIAAVCGALQLAPFTRWLELQLLDAQFRALRALQPRPAPVDVALVGIDEATLQAFPEPLALWHRRLAGVLYGLAMARPRAVGVDVELPERSYDFVQPGLDAELLRALVALRAVCPVVIARGVDGAGRVKPVHAPFLAVAGADGLGLATWEFDVDLAVRRFDERQGEADADVPTLTGTLARRLGARPRPGLIDFTLGAPFGYVPAHEVSAWAAADDAKRLQSAFADRVVLVGSVLPFVDRHRIPVQLAGWETSSTVPGVVAHGQALRTLLGPGAIADAPVAATLLLVLAGAGMWFAFAGVGGGVAALAIFAAGAFSLGTWLLQRGVYLPVAGAIATAGLAGTLRVGYESWFNRRQRQRLRAAFAGAVSPNVLDLILRGELDTAVGSGRRRLCVMFGDIRGFTPYSERVAPEEAVRLLNRYFTRVAGAVHRYGGTLDNFRGDGIMCLFGAPQPTADPCHDAFLAARALFAEVEELNRELAAEGAEPVRIGLALAFGESVVGRIGGAERNEYTAIGDVANVSARIEGLAAGLGYPLVATEAVVQALRGRASFDDLGEQPLKGHSPVRVFGWPPRTRARDDAGRAARGGEP